MSLRQITWYAALALFLASAIGFSAEKSLAKQKWKTFSHHRFGWSIQFPETWIVSIPVEDDLPATENGTVCIDGPRNEKNQKRQYGIFCLDVGPITGGAYASFDSKQYLEFDAHSRKANLINGHERTIDGNSAYEAMVIYSDQKKTTIRALTVKYNQLMFHIRYNELIGEPGTTVPKSDWKYEKMYNEILATLHFTK